MIPEISEIASLCTTEDSGAEEMFDDIASPAFIPPKKKRKSVLPDPIDAALIEVTLPF